MAIPDNITRDDVLDGIRRIEVHGLGRFHDSSTYDVVHGGKRYPPKAVVGHSTYRILGKPLDPSEFSGGEDTACFRILRGLRFEIASKKPAAGWVFQGNPDQFDIEGYIAAHNEILWYIGQEHYISQIAAGHPVFFWRAKGKTGKVNGIIASGVVLAPPEEMPADEKSRPFAKTGFDTEVLWRVRLRVTHRRLRGDVVSGDFCRTDPILKGLRILRQAAGTNYPIGEAELARLQELFPLSVNNPAMTIPLPSAIQRLSAIVEAPNDDLGAVQQAARKMRKGQTKFRNNLLRIHAGRCAVTGTAVEAVLEACHINSHATSGMNHTTNGVLLRSDIHDLFDDGLLTFDTQLLILTAPQLRGTEYEQYQGTRLGARDAAFPIKSEFISQRNARIAWLNAEQVPSH